jgi:PAS domain S-box-containing protein
MKKTTTKKGDHNEKEPLNALELLSRVNDDLVDLPLDADIFAYIARTLQKITPKGTVILVNSLDRQKNEVVLQAFEGLGSYLPHVEEILGRPLKGISFPVPEPTMIPMRAGECTELFGGVKELTFGALPEETCQKLEALQFFGRVYSAGICWKGELHGAATFILPPGMHLPNPRVVTQFIRRIAGYLQRREIDLALQESEERLRLALGAAEIGIWSWNLATSVRTHTNSGLLFGYTSAELEDYFRHLDTNSHPDDPAIDEVMKNILTESQCGNGAVSEFGRRIRAKDGTWRWAHIQGKVVACDTAGKPLLLMGTIRDITERKQAEEALRESENKFATIFLSSPVALTLVSATDGTFVDVNDAFLRNTGYSREEVIGKTSEALGIFTDKNERERMLSALRDQRCVCGMEVKCRTKPGEIRTCRFSSSHILMSEKPYILSTIEDITDRKRAEEALRESEERYRALVDNALEAILIFDFSGTALFANHATAALVEVDDPRALMGRNVMEFIAPESRNTVLADFASVMQGRDSYFAYYKVITATGREIWVEVIGKKIQFGGAPADIVMLRDITERKQTEDALRESEERYRSLAETAQDIIFIIDRNDTIVYVNSYCQQMLRKPFEDIIGKPRKALFPESDSARQYQSLQRVFTTGIPLRVESQVPISGQARWQDTHLMPLKAADGSIYAVLGISRDITEQKVLYETVQRANKKLNLLSSITRHDIINQLMALNGYLDLSRDILGDPVKLEEYITKEQNIARTIEDQIRFTKDYQDLGIKAPEWQNVHGCIIKAKQSLSLRGIGVETDSPTLEIYADPLLERVFYNLIDNALRYGGPGMKTIRVTSQEIDSWLLIVCEDDGVGISAEDKKHLFTRGYGKNTGLGLFLAREILSITGITIAENGTPGKGARFEIAVPKGMWRFTGTGDNKPEK